MMRFFFALGCGISLVLALIMYSRAIDHATTLAHCIRGGSFTVVASSSPSARGRVVNCVVVDTHEGVKKRRRRADH